MYESYNIPPVLASTCFRKRKKTRQDKIYCSVGGKYKTTYKLLGAFETRELIYLTGRAQPTYAIFSFSRWHAYADINEYGTSWSFVIYGDYLHSRKFQKK